MPRVAALYPDFDHIRRKVAADEALTDPELMVWQRWSRSTIERYRGLGMPCVTRPGMRKHSIPSRVTAWLAGEEPQRPAPRRGRPRKHAAVC